MAGMTITEKILARHSGRLSTRPGDTLWVDVDLLLAHDACGPGAITIFQRELGAGAKVWDGKKIAMVPDHFMFSSDQLAQRNVHVLKDFIKEQGLVDLTGGDVCQYPGICHLVLAENQFTMPGSVILGTDSHTTTAGAFGAFATGIGETEAAFLMATGKLWIHVPQTVRVLFDGVMPPYLMAKDLILASLVNFVSIVAAFHCIEFAGPVIETLPMDERMTLTNMAAEMGVNSSIIAPDRITATQLNALHRSESWDWISNDADAQFASLLRLNVRTMSPQVAAPDKPHNVRTVEDLKGVAIDRAFIGSCTGGKLHDFICAAQIIADREVVVETLCIPGTKEIERQLNNIKIGARSVREVLECAGVRFAPPSCGPCASGPADTPGRLSDGQTCISTSSRNYPGRMGSPNSRVFLASPFTVAASAISGIIADPRPFLA